MAFGVLALTAVLAPPTAEAVQARVTIQCGGTNPSAAAPGGTVTDTTIDFPFGNFKYTDGTTTALTTAKSVNLASGAPNGLYVDPENSACQFKIVGTAQFTADAAKIGQLYLNNLSIRNVGTQGGTVNIVYRHQNTAADPNVAQCVSLSADGFFYAGSTVPTGDGFDLDMTVEYFKSGAVHQQYVVGSGRILPTAALPNNTSCPSTSNSTIALVDGLLKFQVATDPFFNPQNPAQAFNRIPACTGCSTGTTSTSGARITKELNVFLKPNQHEISAIATMRGAMAEQAEKPRDQAAVAAANQFLAEVNTADTARMDLKPGQSVNFMHLTSDQGMILADLFGGPCDDPDKPCFDIRNVDAAGLLLFAGRSGLDGPDATAFFAEPGALIVKWQYGDFNKDGRLDLRGQWSQKDLIISPGDDRVQIRGTIFVNGMPTLFTAEDSAVTQQ